MEDKTEVQAQMLFNRLQKRFRHLKKWARRRKIGAFRLYDRDIPEIPLVLDFYGDCSRTGEAALAGALYKRPYEKDKSEEEAWLSVMTQSASSALGIKPCSIFLKYRQRQRGLNQYEKTGETRYVKIVSEGDLIFKVNLSDYLDTGLFPDRRLLRRMVLRETEGKKVLNLFSYTGSFSVYAAAGGAASVDSVDLSNTYLNWAKDNFSLNGFSAEFPVISHKGAQARNCDLMSCSYMLIRADAAEFIRNAINKRKSWDIIILDPPAFSNSKKMAGNFDLKRDLAGFLEKCIKTLAPGGKLFLSLNTRGFSPGNFNCNNVRVTNLDKEIIDEDFLGKKTPQGFLLTKLL
ncbi:MAG: class I SAM-dependent methyltransferase [Treponema sp.]|nr:class I SAM-dependent methyltransferase [Treponema sp.]MCL2271894.1 class I SAM-dependent methyltransferase [Treponema sp.]